MGRPRPRPARPRRDPPPPGSAGIRRGPRRPPQAAGPMASTSAEIIAFLLTVSGWVLISSTLPTDYWKVSTIDGTVITTATFWANLWKTCVTDSTGVSNCKDFPSMLALDGQAPCDPLPGTPRCPCAPAGAPGRGGRALGLGGRPAGPGAAGHGQRRLPRAQGRCPLSPGRWHRAACGYLCKWGFFLPKTQLRLYLVPECPVLASRAVTTCLFPPIEECVCGFDTRRMQANFSCRFIFRPS